MTDDSVLAAGALVAARHLGELDAADAILDDADEIRAAVFPHREPDAEGSGR